MSAPHAHRILLVEDDDNSRDAMHALLELDGIAVQSMSSGREALEALRSGVTPCLVLLDMRMADGDGTAFRAEQRADGSLAHIPVVLISGSGDIEARAREMGVDYILKPIDPEKLRTIVEEHCLSDTAP